MWTIFWTIVISALAFDLTILTKQHHKLSNNQLIGISLMWFFLAMLFGIIIYCRLGTKPAYEFLTGYLIEYTLSVDNLFIFISIFSYFKIIGHPQQKALTFGIIGAIIMRFIFIFVGIKLVELFSWVFHIFGIILILTGLKTFKTLLNHTPTTDNFRNGIINFLSKFLPIKSHDTSTNLIIHDNGKIFLTRTMVAILAIELCDFTFAIDSIPAILSITQNELIVYSSNIFAVIGLRSLYFILHQITTQFVHLKYSIAAILIFIGIKMILSKIFPIPTTVSLLFVVSTIVIAIIASLIKKRSKIA